MKPRRPHPWICRLTRGGTVIGLCSEFTKSSWETIVGCSLILVDEPEPLVIGLHDVTFLSVCRVRYTDNIASYLPISGRFGVPSYIDLGSSVGCENLGERLPS